MASEKERRSPANKTRSKKLNVSLRATKIEMKEKKNEGQFLEPCDISRKLCKVFNKMQHEEFAVTKAVNVLRKLHEEENDTGLFFNHFVHLLSLPLSKGTSKDRMTTFEEKCFEVACKFSTSFLQKEDTENQTITNDNQNDESLIELPPFLRDIFDWLLDHHEVESSGARLKVCMLINRLLKLLGEEAEIDDELYEKIHDNMIERLKDKVAEIRAQAVHALQRLQDPRDDQCPIIKAFIFHMGCDPSAFVRKAIVRCIGATKITLPHVLKRTLDVDENVRKAAYKFIADKVHIRSLTIARREEIIRRGLTDRNENVRKVVAKHLVPAWLRFCNEKIVELLYALDVGNSDGTTAKEVLLVLFQGVPYEELVQAFQFLDPNTRLIPKNKLSPETASYWRNLASYLYDESEVKGVSAAAVHLENILPELTPFCNYIRELLLENDQEQQTDSEDPDKEEAEKWQRLFNGQQLIHMISLFDLGDVAGRNNLLALVKELLLNKNVPHSLVEPLLKIHRSVQTNPQQRIHDITEIIAELRDPMKAEEKVEKTNSEENKEESEDEENVPSTSKAEKDKMVEGQQKKKVEIAKIKVKLNILRDDLENAIRDKDFLKAQDLQLDVDDLDSKLIHLNEELALMIIPPSVEKRIKTKARTEASAPAETQQGSSQTQKGEEDPQIIHKCLAMLVQLLQSPDITSLNSTLLTILDEFVKPCVGRMDFEIRNMALKSVGCFSLRSLDVAKQNILLVLQMAHLDTLEVRKTALEVIFDLLMWYGLQGFLDTECDNIESVLDSTLTDTYTQGGNTSFSVQGTNPIVAVISKLLDDRDLDIRTKVTEGLCKLMMSKVITSAKLFTRLILMWYNPVTETHGKLRHILGAFFPLYASLDKENQAAIEESFMPTLKTLFSAPVTSPLNEVDVEDVGLFLIQLTARGFLQSNEIQENHATCHDSMAYAICNQIIAQPMSFHVKILLKLLTSLQISDDDFSKLKELKALQAQMMELVKDKLAFKTIEKFGKYLELALEKHQENNKENDADEESNDENQMTDPSPPSDETVSNNTTVNNTTRFGRKRPLFSQTSNHLIVTPLKPEAPKKGSSSVKDIIPAPIAEVSSEDESDDDLFGTPKANSNILKMVNPDGEVEITRIEESPISSGDNPPISKKGENPTISSEDMLNTTDEIVSGNVQGKLKKASPRRGRTRGRPTNRKSIPESTPEESSESSEKSIPDLGESSEELFPATSTQIENPSRPRRSRRSQ